MLSPRNGLGLNLSDLIASLFISLENRRHLYLPPNNSITSYPLVLEKQMQLKSNE